MIGFLVNVFWSLYRGFFWGQRKQKLYIDVICNPKPCESTGDVRALSPIGVQIIPNHVGFNGGKSSFFPMAIGEVAEPHKSLRVIFSSCVVD